MDSYKEFNENEIEERSKKLSEKLSEERSEERSEKLYENEIEEQSTELDIINKKLDLIIEYMTSKINILSDENKLLRQHISNLESNIVSINEKLLNQNIKLSDSLIEKSEKINYEQNKNIFYKKLKEHPNYLFISGTSTYNNKDKLKEYGEWDSNLKVWKLKITISKLKELFPNASEKIELSDNNNNLQNNIKFREE